MMSKTCPSCGYRETDMQAMYCNKCGYPFPPSQQRRAAAAAPAPSAAGRRPAAAPRALKRTPRQGGRASGSFGPLITENHLKLIYLAGAVLILLVAILGIAGMYGKAETPGANMSVTNLTAVADKPAASPLFWIGFLLAGSILWRMFCEMFVLLSRTQGQASHGGFEEEEDEDSGEYAGDETEGGGEAYEGTMVECPKCHRIVPTDDLRECEHCGIQGCSTCIRSMGFLKKTLTCRECYEGQ